MFKATNHILNKKKLREMEADIALARGLFPGLTVIYKRHYPSELVGNFKIEDNNGVEQGNWDIRILLPDSYPYGFPALFETSTKIIRSDDTHISEEGKACVELDINERIIAKKGIRIHEFVKNYVFKYFCWILLYEAGERSSLDFWDHKEVGQKRFFYLMLETENHDFILKCFNLVLQNIAPSRNDPCFCGSTRKFKQCHEFTIYKLKKFDNRFLKQHEALFH